MSFRHYLKHSPMSAMLTICGCLLFSGFGAMPVKAQVVPVGSGSYTTVFPGTDAAGRNGYPSGSPQLSGNALGKPVPTNDWWSKLVKEDHADNLFNYPYTLKTVNSGLVVSYIPFGVISNLLPITVGVTGLSATRTTVSDYSDWTVTMDWNDNSRNFKATSGIGMPFLYFTKQTTDVASVTVASGTVVVDNEMLVITNAINGADFAVYAPVGSTWVQTGSTYTSTLNGKNYWSMAFIPLTASNVTAVANEYKKYAYVFPANTLATWSYNPNTSVVRTDFTVTTDIKEGVETQMLLGLLPHQWGNLAANSPQPTKYSYASIRGELKTMAGNTFSVENTFYGILPTLPYLNQYSAGFSPALLAEKVETIENNKLDLWTDSYNEGQLMNRLIQTARIAHEMGNITARDLLLATIKERLEDWLTVQSGEVAFLYYYNATWSALIGYPAGHGQDANLNDHHFHWGYFIHAASFVEQFQPGWAAQWGDMVNMLVRDAAGTDRNDTMFPYLRNFSPYAGHCWANGFATFPQGNDQESTSESMQFNSSLIHWGTITGNTAVRDLGIYLYTTEQSAVEEYWFDVHERVLPAAHAYSLVSRVWGNSYDNGTFWTSDIAASYGIELYPIHGGSLYLGHRHNYVSTLWNEIKANTGISSNEVNANLWHDIMWQYAAFIDPAEAIAKYDTYPNRALKFGVSDAQTYYWLHAMNALGRVDTTITANYPIAAAFTANNKTIYVAHNYGNTPIVVAFSSGYQLTVPARTMRTSEDIAIAGTLTSSFAQAYTNGSVQLALAATGGTPSKVEFMDGSTLIGTVTAAPFVWNATQLAPGKHNFYARVYVGQAFNLSNAAQVIVGDQVAYNGSPWLIPGEIEAGKYDIFEGGNGQKISYLDMSMNNEGDFRANESVDAATVAGEGATVGWISAGEWLEYTVNVAQSGLYSVAFRYASGNAKGGGPFTLSLDGQEVATAISVASTSTTNWNTWATKTVTNIPLTAGEHVLRLSFSAGEFNLGKMTFTQTGNIPYSFPIAKAGANVIAVLPATTAALDGSASTESTGQPITYAWTQVYGPSVMQFSNAAVVNPTVSNLVQGIYKVRLTVTNTDQRYSSDELYLIVSNTANVAPIVSLVSPTTPASYREGTTLSIAASATDFDGSIVKVDFYRNGTLIGSDQTAPYSILWTGKAGKDTLTATATDNLGVASTSQAQYITFIPVLSCSGNSKQASQGAFTVGYNYTFETVGNDVTVTFGLLDNKPGTIAYLWNQTPFSEKSMNPIGGDKFSTIITGQKLGATISVACKFAFAGGMAVTKYINYVVGSQCDVVSIESDAAMAAPLLFPAPANDRVFVQFANPLEAAISWEIVALDGKSIHSGSLREQLSEIPTATLSAGVYLLRLHNPRFQSTQKLIIAR